MLTNSLYSPMYSIKNVVITLRKLMTKVLELNNTKVMIVVKTNIKDNQALSDDGLIKRIYEISQAKKIKNGIACFYGESIVLSQSTRNFSITVYIESGINMGQSRKELARFFIGKEKIKEFSERKIVFSSSSDFIHLVWQAQIQSENTDRVEQSIGDRSLQDFEDIEVKKQDQIQKQLIARKQYSPAVKGEIRRRCNIFRRDDSRSELISESPHKFTADTNETITMIKRKVLLVQAVNNKNQKQDTNKIGKGIKTQQDLNISYEAPKSEDQADGLQKVEKFEHPVLTPIKPKPRTESFIYKKGVETPKTERVNHFAPKKKIQKLYQKVNLKYLIYSSVVGILGGMTAAQF